MISHKDSPLGAKTRLYLKKESKNGSILLIPEEQTLEFYPVKYTKTGDIPISHQHVLQQIWDIAVSKQTENCIYPLDDVRYNIRLVKFNSTKDPYKMRVVVKSPVPGSILSHLDGLDIGYCPMRISKEVHENLSMFNSGRILKIRAEFHKKYFTAKVIFGYGKSRLINTDLNESNRFFDMAEEIK